MNEFGALTPDELHFLRVFIYCEGRIRDMEAALGVSYPTVKGHLASIKEKLNLARIRPAAPPPHRRVPRPAQRAAGRPRTCWRASKPGRSATRTPIRLLKAKKKEAKNDEKHGS